MKLRLVAEVKTDNRDETLLVEGARAPFKRRDSLLFGELEGEVDLIHVVVFYIDISTIEFKLP